MPELPEVEAARRAAAAVAVGRRITGAHRRGRPDRLRAVRSRADPARAPRPARRGRAAAREALLAGARSPALALRPLRHGGGLSTTRRKTVRLRSSRRRAEAGWPPRFTRLVLEFDDGGALAIADGRRLGRIRLRREPTAEPPSRASGSTRSAGCPPPARFRALARARAAPVKALLLDQSFAAGVGNWIADEVLYQARIAPRRPGPIADGCRARPPARPAPRRRPARRSAWARTATGSPGRGCSTGDGAARPGITARGDAIRWETIAGRTAAWVPAVQR